MKHSEGFLKLVGDAKKNIQECSVDDVWQRQQRGEKLVLVDVREDSEWARGHAEGALHLSRGVLERDIEKVIPDKDTEIILYCGGGFRSALSAENLGKMGYKHVSSMDGGFRGWLEAGMPVTKD
ncbi:MAG TPA: rhodanese-like domain-containing protein [Candidatus Eisenbacteria bacterium]|jgi:rhodanese-related sulfurtransferase|nr:rhodanese-like domain-containing protein [Candidatus Eisenbacteria bacterium]